MVDWGLVGHGLSIGLAFGGLIGGVGLSLLVTLLIGVGLLRAFTDWLP